MRGTWAYLILVAAAAASLSSLTFAQAPEDTVRPTGTFDCNCTEVEQQTTVRQNTTAESNEAEEEDGEDGPEADPSWSDGTQSTGPLYVTGSNETSDETCVLPCWLNSTGLPMTEQDLQEVRYNCYLEGSYVENATLFVTTDAELLPPCLWEASSPTNMQGPSCGKGYTCRWTMEVCDMNTWPLRCTPEPLCNVRRLSSFYCDNAQNPQEPVLCKAGYECSHRKTWRISNDPDSIDYQWMETCPAGSYCPLGTYEAKECDLWSACPAGMGFPMQYALFLVVLAFDIVLAVGLFYRKRHLYLKAWRFQKRIQVKKDGKDKDEAAEEGAEAPEDEGGKKDVGTDEAGVELSGVKLRGVPQGAKASSAAAAPKQAPSSGKGASALEKLVGSFVRSRGEVFSIAFEFEELGLSLPTGRKILSSVSGSVMPAHVTAIMGPSGAGKTTFLNTLMGRVPKIMKPSGVLRINGAVIPVSHFKRGIGFVPQEDVMHRHLTVRDNIEYSARVRLPPIFTEEEITAHVDTVLELLDIAHVQYSVVGGEKVRGVSGGQRKRVNIGMEVAACPVALFLDEPTSGLDSTSALHVIDSLQKISRATGLTVAMVIHQPRKEIWDGLDDLLLLAPGGRTVFQGPQDGVEQYFRRQLGVVCAPGDNPADMLMDVIADRADTCVDAWNKWAGTTPGARDSIYRSPGRRGSPSPGGTLPTVAEMPTNEDDDEVDDEEKGEEKGNAAVVPAPKGKPPLPGGGGGKRVSFSDNGSASSGSGKGALGGSGSAKRVSSSDNVSFSDSHGSTTTCKEAGTPDGDHADPLGSSSQRPAGAVHFTGDRPDELKQLRNRLVDKFTDGQSFRDGFKQRVRERAAMPSPLSGHHRESIGFGASFYSSRSFRMSASEQGRSSEAMGEKPEGRPLSVRPASVKRRPASVKRRTSAMGLRGSNLLRKRVSSTAWRASSSAVSSEEDDIFELSKAPSLFSIVRRGKDKSAPNAKLPTNAQIFNDLARDAAGDNLAYMFQSLAPGAKRMSYGASFGEVEAEVEDLLEYTDESMQKALQDAIAQGRRLNVPTMVEALASAGAQGDLKSQAKQILAFAALVTGPRERIDVNAVMLVVRGHPRGAYFGDQLLLAFARAGRTYINSPRRMLTEALVHGVVGYVIGLASSQSFRGVLLDQYQFISPAGNPNGLMISALLLVMGAGIAAAPPGVSSFGAELVVYWREAAAGHRRFAYFLGKICAALLMICFGVVHFCALFLLGYSGDALDTPVVLGVVGACYFAFFSLAMVCGIGLETQQATLLSVMFSLLLPVLGGLLPSIPEGVQMMSLAKYGMEVIFHRGTEVRALTL